MTEYDLDPANAKDYRDASEGYIHYMHGVNPLGMVMLTNMYDYGAEKSVNEIYHGWFHDGTDFDNALSSLYGPPPGYVTGGPNPTYEPDASYPGDIIPPQNQPIQKSYKDWNTSWPENSWEITEPAIYYQAAYIKLLSKFVSSTPVSGVRKISADNGSAPVIYPNPAENYFVVKSESTPIMSVTVFDLNGRKINYKKTDFFPYQVIINTGLLVKGIYVVKVNTVEGVHYGKVVIKK
jgi:hypothetical protein